MSFQVGNIDERGYLNGLTRRGYTHAKCILELVANVLDSMDSLQDMQGQPRLVFDIQQGYTYMIDNAAGMKEEDVKNMFSLHRQNHASDASRGVSGIGAKPALSILSERKNMFLFTKHANGPYLKISVPWNNIHESGVYTGKIEVSQMNDAEKEQFMSERAANGMFYGVNPHGTTIRFPTNTALTDILQKNFQNVNETDLDNPLDRISIVFGSENLQILYKHFEESEPKILSLYNYFGHRETNFYTGVSTHTIHQWSNDHENRFLWTRPDGNYEILPHGRGFSTQPSPTIRNMRGYQHVGYYNVKIGLRSDTEYFDPQNPTEPQNTTTLYGEDKEFLADDNHDYLHQIKLYRNNMLIGLIPTPDIKISSSRASTRADLEYRRIQVHVGFFPVSLQDNAQDRAMNIQENKNQFDGKSISLPFTRLLKAMRKEKADSVWNYFETVMHEHRSRIPLPIHPVIHENADTDESDDSGISPVSEPSERPPSIHVDSDDEEKAAEESNFSSPLPSPRIDPAPAPAPAPAPQPIVEPLPTVRKTHMTFNLSSLHHDLYLLCLHELEQIQQRYSLNVLE
jgi:hypothetical protein